MKKFMLLVVTLVIVSVGAFAEAKMEKKKKMRYTAVPMEKATLVQKGDAKKFCNICGMTLPMFYRTSHAAKHTDSHKQYCSIHCLVEDKEVNGSDLSEYKVVDNTSLKLIDVKTAFYVVGSNKPATMAKVSKYAFANESDAKAFAKANGGEIKKFDDVYKIVSSDLKEEIAMIAKKQKKMQKMGEKVYNKMCKKTDKKFSDTAEAKTFVSKNKLCGDLKGKKLQAVGIYLGRR